MGACGSHTNAPEDNFISVNINGMLCRNRILEILPTLRLLSINHNAREPLRSFVIFLINHKSYLSLATPAQLEMFQLKQDQNYHLHGLNYDNLRFLTVVR